MININITEKINSFKDLQNLKNNTKVRVKIEKVEDIWYITKEKWNIYFRNDLGRCRLILEFQFEWWFKDMIILNNTP